MASQDVDSRIDYGLKVVLIRNSTVGKSHILSCFAENEFSLDYMAMIRVEFQIMTLLDKNGESSL
ncbi:hypothetical protein CRG98_031408 [Punica granatum]|uniref:Uncharacterized protein n=1 Tax=Punica granatum TaxID=22663 RepID=A0A2I0IWL7_PUNGR|nr:hypothetical protein CRG98_031408 [Punica granatum]